MSSERSTDLVRDQWDGIRGYADPKRRCAYQARWFGARSVKTADHTLWQWDHPEQGVDRSELDDAEWENLSRLRALRGSA